MNFVGTLQSGTSNNQDVRIAIYRLVNPHAGAGNVSITTAANASIIAQAITFNGVDQTTPIGPFQTASADNGSPSGSFSSATGEVLYSVFAIDDIGAASANSSNRFFT